MRDLAGGNAVVTGAGSGIGRGLALGLARRGMRLVVSDIEADAAAAVAAELVAGGAEAVAQPCDVADFASVNALAELAVDRFGPVHVLCNNAGVLIMADVKDLQPGDWEWIYSVNVMGVVHGIHAFLPGMLAAGAPAHILNTGSVAGLGGGGAYGSSKAAVIAISESLRTELAPHGIGVSVLLPGNVSSRITSSQRNRDARYGRHMPEPFADVVDFGLDPVRAAELGVRAIVEDELYAFVFPTDWEPRLRAGAEERQGALLGAMERGGI